MYTAHNRHVHCIQPKDLPGPLVIAQAAVQQSCMQSSDPSLHPMQRGLNMQALSSNTTAAEQPATRHHGAHAGGPSHTYPHPCKHRCASRYHWVHSTVLCGTAGHVCAAQCAAAHML